MGKLGKSGECEEKSYGRKNTAVDDSQWRTQESTYEKKDGKNQRDIKCFHQYKYLSKFCQEDFYFCQEFEEFENFSLITYPLRAVNVASLFLKFLTKNTLG